MHIIHSVFAALLTVHVALAKISPSEPSPGTVWTPGQEHIIEWGVDDLQPAIDTEWSHFTIDFMTGDNNKQGVDASKSQQYKWKVPTVDIPAPIYFFMFTSNSGKYNEWTTRFTITSLNGTRVEAPHKDSAEFETMGRKDGSAPIPWGIGKIVSEVDTTVNAAANISNGSQESAGVGDHFSSILVKPPTASPPSPSVVLMEAKNHLGSSANKQTTSFGLASASILSLVVMSLLQ